MFTIIPGSSQRKDSTSYATTAVLRKTGSTKIFVAVILAITVAIAVIVTASDLWDGASLVTIFDDLAAPATIVIPNVSDVWSITLDAVDSTLSSEWLIPPAFALTVTSPANQTVTEGDTVTITFTITDAHRNDVYFWEQVPSEPAIAIPTGYDVTTVTFTAPEVSADVTIKISHIILYVSPGAGGFSVRRAEKCF